MLVLEKPFIDIDKQIDKLIGRGLIINDRNKAKKQLLKTTYYDLINGYKDIFLVNKKGEEDAYREGTTIDQIIELYDLDRHLRYSTLELLLDIECKFYSSLSYSISEIYGEKEDDYLKIENFKKGAIQRHNGDYERNNLLKKINKKIKYPNVQPLKYYKEKYNNIPPWIFVKDLTFGELVMLYKLSSNDVKKNVIKNILSIDDINDSIKELQQLDKTTYKRVFINPLLKKYNVNTVKLYHRLFKIAINAAVDDEILTRNRFNKISIKDPTSNEIESVEENFLTAGELNKLLKTTQEHANITTYTIILLLAYTGLRRGEAYGLKWSDIDLKNKTVSVNRTRDNKGTRTPKTANSYRTILIDDIVVNQLKAYKKWSKETLFTFGKKLINDSFVFISYQTGEPVTTNLILYALRKMIQKANIKSITPHGLRHTHATLLISKGVNVKVIADRLGNTPGMILDIYGHSFKQLEEESVNLFSKSLEESGADIGANS
ncbi:tyrosine-type recombinase/integrase [Bacillus sp. JCM 19034]|uniref:tyrosine-type recombinase/integrase n=1 Tax=Bacillus sp. JCM 19034 TaxID=1481928 RepID=UPI00078233BC|nr:tyrosine-type recombinase/integrase [Bacillus sp. JCM 19034]